MNSIKELTDQWQQGKLTTDEYQNKLKELMREDNPRVEVQIVEVGKCLK